MSAFRNGQFLFGRIGAERVTSAQPMTSVWEYENEWKYSICDVCTNKKVCCCAFLCYFCFVCELHNRTGECFCTPFAAPGSMIGLRSKVRTGFRIKGSLCDDCMATTFLPCCSAIQLHNELNEQGL